MKKLTFLFLLSFLMLQLAIAQIPQEISYQGVLTESNGAPVPDGNYSMTFSLYDVATGGTEIWQEAKTVSVEGGVFDVILGDVVSLSNDFNDEYWLGVTVGADPEMTPRVKLTASAYSLNSAAVQGYGVSLTPTPNTLLPLDGDGKFPASALPSINMGQSSVTTSVTITSTSFVEISSFTINESGTYDVTLSGNLVAEINGDGSGRYEFKINKGSVDGTQIGRAWWRPGSSDSFQALTFSLSGVDNDVTGPTTYYLVGRKFDSGAKDALVFIHNFHAMWVEK